MTERVDAVVIGAGVVGLAIARALSRQGREVVVIERHARIGEEISARNSEVIHAGLYYPTNGLKARLCVRGREQLYAYCAAKEIPHARCGKLIVAVGTRQLDALDALHRQALANGVDDVEMLTGAEVARREPAVRCAAGLRSPSTGIVDSHALMLALRADIEAAGGAIAVLSRFAHARIDRGLKTLRVEAEGSETVLEAGVLINSAGLAATSVARAIEGLDAAHVPTTRYAKGNYFMLQGPSPFRELIYPLPEPGGLGVHVTLDLAGRARFGPDVEWVEKIDYDVDPSRSDAFYAAIRTYWPAIAPGSLVPGYAGIRPKIVGRKDPPGDFVISGPAAHGIDGLVNLFGIESPGLTASLAIADHVVELLGAG